MKNKRLIIKIESLLNRTPHVGIIIFFLTLATLVASAILSKTTGTIAYKSIDPITYTQTQSAFEIKNFLLPENFMTLVNGGIFIFSSMSTTVTIIVTLLAFGVAEKSGFLYTIFKKLLFNVPPKIVTFVLVTVGVLSNVTSNGELNAGYLILLPISAFIYIGNNRNPLAGIAAMFASIFAGYSINLLLTTNTLALNAITQELTNGVISDFVVEGSSNRFLMFGLIISAIAVISTLTEKYISNILPIYDLKIYTYHKITGDEKRGLLVAMITTVVIVIAYIYMLTPKIIVDLPGSGILLGDYNPIVDSYLTQLIKSPFFSMFVMHISYYFIIVGLVYGMASRKFKSLNEVVQASVVSIADHAEYFVLAFLLSQLIHALYNSNIGLYVLLELTAKINSASSPVMAVVMVFIITAIANLLVPATTTKWTVMGPVVVPLFLGMSLNPILAQTVYQAGDSVTNTITLIMPYTIFAYVLFRVYAKKTKQHCGNGTLFKLTFPYSIALFFTYLAIVVIWVSLGIDLGPGVRILI